jgi:uncharacterized membrane protein (DUF106 family)
MLTVFLISAAVSFTLAMLYKILTNQEELKEANEGLKELNKKIKEAQKNKDQKEMMKLQSQMLELNSKKMKNTMKPMMGSFIIIIPIFIFLFPALFGDLTVELDDSMNGIAEFNGVKKEVRLEKEPLSLKINGEEKGTDEVIEIGQGIFTFKNFDSDNGKVDFKRVVVEMPFSFPIWGSHIGWLGWYILASIPLATIFRKGLGIVQ